AEGHGRRYGTLREPVVERLRSGGDVLLVIDVQGAEAFREVARGDPSIADALSTIFLQPANIDQLRQRIHGRGTESEAEIETRLETARHEIAEAPKYDYVVTTGTREEDFTALLGIYQKIKRSR
ncbi:MAG: guanylate kinase, partial [Opitutales bacterium]